jgi:uncharacterized protein (TIGR00251 family)
MLSRLRIIPKTSRSRRTNRLYTRRTNILPKKRTKRKTNRSPKQNKRKRPRKIRLNRRPTNPRQSSIRPTEIHRNIPGRIQTSRLKRKRPPRLLPLTRKLNRTRLRLPPPHRYRKPLHQSNRRPNQTTRGKRPSVKTSRRNRNHDIIMKLQIRVQPNSSQQKIQLDLNGQIQKVYLTKQAIDGKANKELEKMLTKHFKSPTKIIKGHTSKTKTIEVKEKSQ